MIRLLAICLPEKQSLKILILLTNTCSQTGILNTHAWALRGELPKRKRRKSNFSYEWRSNAESVITYSCMKDRRLYSSGTHEARINHMTVVYDLLSIIRGKNE